jgi:hypothetical protein
MSILIILIWIFFSTWIIQLLFYHYTSINLPKKHNFEEFQNPVEPIEPVKIKPNNEAKINENSQPECKTPSAFEYLNKHAVLDSSISAVFPDYTRPEKPNQNRTNFEQIDLYLENAPVMKN